MNPSPQSSSEQQSVGQSAIQFPFSSQMNPSLQSESAQHSFGHSATQFPFSSQVNPSLQSLSAQHSVEHLQLPSASHMKPSSQSSSPQHSFGHGVGVDRLTQDPSTQSSPGWQSYSEQHSTWVISHGLSFVQLTFDGQSHTGPTGYWYLQSNSVVPSGH